MKVIMPSNNDLTEFKVLSRSINSNRTGTQGPLDPRKLILILEIEQDEMSQIWEYQGINMDERSAYQRMLKGNKHNLFFETVKIKKNTFSSVWLANIMFLFDNENQEAAEMYIGSVASKRQAELWVKLKNITTNDVRLEVSPQDALLKV